MIKKISLLVFSLLLGFAGLTTSVLAEEEPAMIFDTGKGYLGGCGLTDKTTWTLDEDLEIKLFQIWYNWDANEKEVGITVKKDGEEFLTGTATRSGCDIYQKNWCNGDLKMDKIFPKGNYELTVDKKKQCAIPDGNGTIRLYGEKLGAVENEPTITAAPTTTPTIVSSLPAQSATAPQKCSAGWCYPVLGILVFSNLITLFLFFRKK
ncbi:hypothetical protein KBI33_01225 [Candidatus Shapirobacteria bacterium]|nr:hypothetical protein [Candidatus Shapirobacteria bacterium]